MKKVKTILFSLAFVCCWGISQLYAQAPVNQSCVGALPIACGQTVVGSTVNSSNDSQAFCGTGNGSAGGNWYFLVGNGQATTITTCNAGTTYDTKIRVYSGSCATPVCVTGNDDISCSFASFRSGVTFTAAPGQVYYILVHGFGSAAGTYEMSVNCVSPPQNDNCVTATPVNMAISNATCSTTAVNTGGASQSSPNPSCTSSSNDDDVWYFFVATSSSAQVEFTNITGGSTVGSALYAGNCAGAQIGCDFASSGNPQSSDIYSGLTPGQVYYLRVWIPGSGSGSFDMCVFAPPSAPCNDDCAGAVCAPPLSCGVSVQGLTDYSASDAAPFCGTGDGSAGGNWYRLIGTGQCYTLTTCNAFSNYDTKIRVYEGSCSNLLCVAGDDDDACSFSGLRSRVTFTSTPGTVYYVLVHGFGSSVGNYQLDVTCASPPSNDNCGAAIPIAVAANSGACVSTSVNSICASQSSPASSCASGGDDDDVWYSFVATTSGIQVQFTNIVGGFSVGSELYAGSCSGPSLGCDFASAGFPDVNDGFCGLQIGQVYYLRVWIPGTGTQGTWDMCVYGVASSANNDCGNAIPVGVGSVTPFTLEQCDTPDGPSPGAGSNSCNSQDGWCSFETDVDNDVWYTFQAPASGCVTIVAAGFDTQLGLWSGSCGSLTEIAANDDDGDQIIANATIFAAGIIEAACLTPGQTYYIQIDGFSGATGNGNLHVIDCGGAPLAIDAGGCQTRFLGYAPVANDTNFLQACATGGVGPYTITWSPSGLFTTTSGNCSNLAVQPGVTTTYCATVTDARGCVETSCVDVVVIDLNCGNNAEAEKVQVCHVPPGNPSNEGEICIGQAAVQAHLAGGTGHGTCRLGPCDNTCLATNPSIAAPTCVDLTISILTDNFGSETSWDIVDVTTNTVIASVPDFTYGNGVSVSETFCVDPDHCYDVTIFDRFGDGICCSFGLGNWSVTFNGATTNSPTGGAFGSSETISVGNCAAKSGQTATSGAEAGLENSMSITAYPNPFATSTVIDFTAKKDAHASVEIFSLTGKKIANIFDGDIKAGMQNKAAFDGSDLSAGVYLYKVSLSTGEVKVGKLFHNR